MTSFHAIHEGPYPMVAFYLWGGDPPHPPQLPLTCGGPTPHTPRNYLLRAWTSTMLPRSLGALRSARATSGVSGAAALKPTFPP